MTDPIKPPVYEKDGNQLKMTATVEQVARYNLSWLKRQRKQIQESRDAELAEVDTLITEAEKLGILEDAELIKP
jgi:hypothetical protein